jgi:hypothetical protein
VLRSFATNYCNPDWMDIHAAFGDHLKSKAGKITKLQLV